MTPKVVADLLLQGICLFLMSQAIFRTVFVGKSSGLCMTLQAKARDPLLGSTSLDPSSIGVLVTKETMMLMMIATKGLASSRLPKHHKQCLFYK